MEELDFMKVNNDNKVIGQFTVKYYRSSRIDAHCRMMSSDNTHVAVDSNVEKVLSDQGFTCDETPRSIYRVKKLYDALNKYVPGRVPDPFVTSEMEQGIALARVCFSKPKNHNFIKMLPMDMRTVIRITSNPKAKAGLTA